MEAEYMNFRFNEEQQMMRKMVRDFAQKEIAPFVPSMEQGVFPKEILQKMGKLGLMGIPAPAKYGGAEMDFISYILAIEEISKVSATVGVILAVHTSVGMNPILYFGTEEQKKNMFLNLQPGIFRCICFNRAQCRIRCRSLKSRAVKKVIIILLMDRKCLLQMVVKQVHTLYSLLQIQRQEKWYFCIYSRERYTWFNHRKR